MAAHPPKRLHSKRPADSIYVSPAKQGGPLSDMALSMLMRDMHATEIKEDRKGWVAGRAAQEKERRDRAKNALSEMFGSR